MSEASELILNASKLRIISHHDSDGIAAAAIAVFVARRLGLRYETLIRNQLSPEDFSDTSYVYWFNDLGSARIKDMKGLKGVITDHHTPVVNESHYTENGDNLYQFNPHLEGLDGSVSQSGSTTTFLFSINLIPEVSAISHVPVIGSVGDLHDKKFCRLVDADREVMLLAERMGLVEKKNDIRYFGRSSKSVAYMLRFGNDPKIGSLYDNPQKVSQFLELHGLDREDMRKIRWIDLDEGKRVEIINSLRDLLESEGGDASRLTGEVYEMGNEPKSSIIKDCRDFSSLINATSRKGKPEVGIRLCLFERGDVFAEAMKLYSDHLDSLRKASRALENLEGKKIGNVVFYDFGEALENNITGTVATRIITHKKVSPSSIVVVMANLGGSKKVSARISMELAERIDLSILFRNAASAVGGSGGGHSNAAGAMIPVGKEIEFINKINEMVDGQQN
ncbi:MAG: DHHA1 domain-containing protein [Thermoplasmatales archaeon]